MSSKPGTAARCGLWIAAAVALAGSAACATRPAVPAYAPEPRPEGAVLPPVPKAPELRARLVRAEFDDLHDELERYRRSSLWDVDAGEERLVLAYRAFEVDDLRFLETLDAWVARRPLSAPALLARAFCELHMAIEARGTGWSKDLTEQQSVLLDRYLRWAVRDARQALALQPRNAAAHLVLLRSYRYNSSLTGPVSREALAAFPASYALHHEEAVRLQPRWSGRKGEYKPLERFVQDAQAHAAVNPRLRRLLGMPFWARAEDLVLEERYAEATALYGKALEFGEAPAFLRSRARAAAWNQEFATAFRDARRLIELAPRIEAVSDEQGILDDVLAIARARASKELQEGRLDTGLSAMDAILAQTMDPGVLAMRATARCRLGDMGRAQEDFGLALRYRPGARDLQRLRTVCGSSQGQVEPAIRRQQAALLDNPGDGSAWHEVAGLYALAWDLRSAVAADRRACDLGHEASCALIQSLRTEATRATPPADLPVELQGPGPVHAQQRLRSRAEREAFLGQLAASEAFRSGGAPPRFRQRPVPRFPAWARATATREGWVDVLIYFDAGGAVAGAEILGGNPQGYFELATLTAVLQWRIEPREAGLKARQKIKYVAGEEDTD